jgi:N-glycosylase/DNA lyase
VIRPRTGLSEIVGARASRGGDVRRRLAEFASVPPSEYFYELLYCLLTPQSSAVNAGRVVDILRGRGFRAAPFDPEPVLARREHYIRFHRTKARRLLAVRERFDDIQAQLSDGRSGAEVRRWLVGNVNGLGWKEASHFLRNIGHRDLAILDRHILKHLASHRVIRNIPATLTEKRYLAIEKKFRAFSARTGIPMDELDLLFWSMETGRILK